MTLELLLKICCCLFGVLVVFRVVELKNYCRFKSFIVINMGFFSGSEIILYNVIYIYIYINANALSWVVQYFSHGISLFI